MKDDQTIDRSQRGSETTDQSSTGVATARSEETPSERADAEANIDKPGAAASAVAESSILEDEKTLVVTGFGPFRHWANSRLRALPGGATLNFAGNPMKVEEITTDGQIRLAYAESFNLVPLDERYIPSLLKQLLPAEE